MKRRPPLPRRLTLLALSLGLTLAAATPQAFADHGPARNHAPGAPTGLTVGDRTDPLALDGAPRFGWLPRDGDFDEVQTAHQVVVRAPGGRTLWDSGKVRGSEQSWVPYGGPALAPGTVYRWKVRTWDRAGAVSPTRPAPPSVRA